RPQRLPRRAPRRLLPRWTVPPVAGRAGVATLGCAWTRKRMLRADSSGAPAADRAVSLTSISTTAPYGSGEARRNTRTESFSANDTLPVTGWPLAVTTHARFVLLRSIDSVNRTESTVPRSPPAGFPL